MLLVTRPLLASVTNQLSLSSTIAKAESATSTGVQAVPFRVTSLRITAEPIVVAAIFANVYAVSMTLFLVLTLTTIPAVTGVICSKICENVALYRVMIAFCKNVGVVSERLRKIWIYSIALYVSSSAPSGRGTLINEPMLSNCCPTAFLIFLSVCICHETSSNVCNSSVIALSKLV
ncbi:unknown [Salmonella phage FelixO1]|uniref:Uncharacterized protein n=1 Tax=Salmonella phage Felix O1 (isolate Felix O1-VT1) TaxID=1283336 RepID=Q6KGG0_BPFO1|nr:unknown [Salmonella phage FelixO1]